MQPRTIPQRELRNNITAILRAAERGTEFVITVRGRTVARLGPVTEYRQRLNVPADLLRARFAETPVDPAFAADVERLRELELPVDERSDR